MSGLRNVLHALWVGAVVLALALVYGLARLGLLLVPGRARRARLLGRLRGRILRRGMTWLGATFIKMGQVMSTRPDLFAPEVIDELRHLQDKLPPFGYAEVARTLDGHFGRPLGEVLAELDEAPVAAASVAQVHRGRLKSGDEVAIKVLRPNVRRQVERDASLLVSGARLLALFPSARLSDPVGHTREFVAGIVDQTNLTVEADHYDRFRKNFDGDPGVRFPRVHRELSGDRVMIMEFIRGRKIDGPLSPAERRSTAVVTRRTVLKMCFQDGFLHCDMHPGNMLIDDGGGLVLFDVGLSKLLSEGVLLQFIDLTKCLTMGSAGDVVAHLRRFHQYVGEVDWATLSSEVDRLILHFRAQDTAHLEYGSLINDLMALARKYRVRPVTDMMLVFVAMITVQGIGKQLDPGANMFAEVAAFLMPILLARGEAIPQPADKRTTTAS